MRKRSFSVAAALLLVCALLAGCGAAPAAPQEETLAPEDTALREFTDDLGRSLSIPAEPEKIAVSGPLAQVYVLPLCPELFVGVCNSYTEDTEKYFSEEIRALPELGQLYGGKGTMDLEALLAAAPDMVIDVGEAKGNMSEELDALTEQTGIPFVHIDATVETAPEAYRRLGELTGKAEQAERLAAWCENCYGMITELMARVDADGARKSILYCLGDKGLNVLAEGSYHADTVNLLGENLAKLTEVVGSGAGNETDMEQLILWDPEVIIFEKDSAYDTAGSDETWQQLSAISSGEYYRSPYGPYGWLASPPSVQRYLGMIWLGTLLYPEYADYDMQELVTEYYEIFYGYELSSEDYAELTARALK